MSGDGTHIDKQAASNALSAWDHAAGSVDGQWKAQATKTLAALAGGDWIGDDDAAHEFKKQFKVDQIATFLDPNASFNPKSDKQSQTGGAITGGVMDLGAKARAAINNQLSADEQQREAMLKAKKQAAAHDASPSPSSSSPSSSSPSSAAPTSSHTSPTSATGHPSDPTAKPNPDLFKGPLQWGIEGADGKWHPLPAHADLKTNEYQGPLQWGIEGSDGKWYPLPPNEHPTSLDDRGPLAHLMPASNDPTATDDRGPLMHIVPEAPSEVVGPHSQSIVDPQAGQQWHGEAAAQRAALLDSRLPADQSATHAATTSAETAPGQPTPRLDASSDTLQQGAQHAATTSAETSPGQPTPVQDHREDVERPG